jgi:hypothetical protein
MTSQKKQRGTTPIGMLFFAIGAVISYFIFDSDWNIIIKLLIFFFVAIPLADSNLKCNTHWVNG